MSKRRYSLMVIEYGSQVERELCQVDNDPHSLAQAAAEKTLRINTGTRVVHVPKYSSVRVVDHVPETPTSTVTEPQ